MMGLFYLLTLYCFIRMTAAEKSSEPEVPSARRAIGLWSMAADYFLRARHGKQRGYGLSPPGGNSLRSHLP